MMSRQISPTFRITVGIVGLTLSLFMATYLLGFLPDERGMQVEARGRIAETLAIQLAGAIRRSDVVTLEETMRYMVKRNDDILSVALRKADGEIVVAAGDHQAAWQPPHDHRSTPTHIQIPLANSEVNWGKIEIAFAPLEAAAGVGGIPYKTWQLLIFIGGWGFIGYYFVLKRALRELDPGKAIPERVQSAFNTLAEGVLILDEQGYVLLANEAFTQSVTKAEDDLFGRNVNELQWRQWGAEEHAEMRPWVRALQDDCNVTGQKLGYKTGDGQFKNFVVNATRILDKTSNQVSGVIVTFDDVTVLERKNDDLIKAVRQLQKSEEEISEQNRELQYLANHDPLTGCLNRRAFFERFADKLEEAEDNGWALTCLMADLDHFKRVNDTYGHAVGDDVIAGMAAILNGCAGDDDLVGRYGGEEFCVALIGKDADESLVVAERIRSHVSEQSLGWLKSGDRITSSLGIATRPDTSCSVKEIVDWADQALYRAKETGRDRVIFWDAEAMSPQVVDNASVQELEQREEAVVSTPDDAVERLSEAALTLFGKTAGRPSDQSPFDPITKLPSPIIFNDRLSQSLLRAEGNGRIVSVLQIAIDEIDRYATLYDENIIRDLIATISTRFVAALKRSDVQSLQDGPMHAPCLSYKGQGLFLLEISDLEETDTVVWFVRRLIDCLKAPITIKDNRIYASAHIGVSLYPTDGKDNESLLRNAGMALHCAQSVGAELSCQFFCEEMNANSRRQLTMESGIRHALDHQQFYLHYQPIVDAKSGRLRGLESLLRSNNPDLAGIPICTLIEVAEKAGLIIEIGEWVLKTAVRQAEDWIEAGFDIPRISVNLSAVQLNSVAAMERLMKIILTMRLSPRRLQFEITETAILKDVEGAGLALMQLQQLGVMIALDDFGTGHSSLSYLRQFRPDTLKIDRCFIGDITSSEADETLVSAIVSMSQRMNIRVVAEGVETRQQMVKVRDIGCDYIQGYYFSRPIASDQMEQWLQRYDGNPINAIHEASSVNVA